MTVQSADEIQRIAEARVKTGDFISRLMMTYVAFATFCVFSLLSPDRLMIIGKASLNVPFAGNVSFLAFMIVAPALLIGMRIYLEIYIGRWKDLDDALPDHAEPRTVSPLKHPILRVFSSAVLYLLLPAMLAIFAWKAMAKIGWADAYLYLTIIAVVANIASLDRWPSIDRRAMVVTGVFLALAIYPADVLPHRGLDLARENLKGAYLANEILWKADLTDADLTGADLTGANLSAATLVRANLRGANLHWADLRNAYLGEANLHWAHLRGADLRNAHLTGADLSEAVLVTADLRNAHLHGADLTGADLTWVDFSGAILGIWHLRRSDSDTFTKLFTDLSGAVLRNANFSGADLSGVVLTQAQLDKACSDPTRPPMSLPKDKDGNQLIWRGEECSITSM